MRGGTVRLIIPVLTRPMLWATALRQARRLTPARWWRRWPFLPVPAGEYMAFRLQTQYGDNAHPPGADDVVNYLRWCRDWERSY